MKCNYLGLWFSFLSSMILSIILESLTERNNTKIVFWNRGGRYRVSQSSLDGRGHQHEGKNVKKYGDSVKKRHLHPASLFPLPDPHSYFVGLYLERGGEGEVKTEYH